MEDAEIIRRRLRAREEAIRRVRSFAESLRGRYAVVLVGSYARGDFNVWSDVDVVVVGDFAGNPLERLKGIDAPPGFEIIPLTPAELVERALKRDPLLKM
jgi:predicted nucleotidyltransferase